MKMMTTRGLYEDEFEALKTVVGYLTKEKKEYEGRKGREGEIPESAKLLAHFLDSEERFIRLYESSRWGLWPLIKENWRDLVVFVPCIWLGVLLISGLIEFSVKRYCSH